MAENDHPKDSQSANRNANGDAGTWPQVDRRSTTLDWLTPVSVDGAGPVQRRHAVADRSPTERRRAAESPAMAADTCAVVFPGQGAQAVGMGADLAEAFPVARRVFEEVDETLGQDLSGLMREGPEDELRLTRNTQPAMMAVSMALVRTLEAEAGLSVEGLGRFVAGHSLGEYTALTAAGGLSIGDAARVLRARGEAMQRAVPVGEGAMAALSGLDADAAAAVAAEAAAGADGEVCVAANDNAPGQVVISGHKAAVERAIEIAASRGSGRTVLLPVSAPFHSPLMAPAAEELAEVLGGVTIARPCVPLVSNVTAAEVVEPDEIRRLLIQQVTGTVRWRECVGYLMASGITGLVEVGFGRVLTGLARRIDRGLSATSVGTPQDIEGLLRDA